MPKEQVYGAGNKARRAETEGSDRVYTHEKGML